MTDDKIKGGRPEGSGAKQQRPRYRRADPDHLPPRVNFDDPRGRHRALLEAIHLYRYPTTELLSALFETVQGLKRPLAALYHHAFVERRYVFTGPNGIGSPQTIHVITVKGLQALEHVARDGEPRPWADLAEPTRKTLRDRARSAAALGTRHLAHSIEVATMEYHVREGLSRFLREAPDARYPRLVSFTPERRRNWSMSATIPVYRSLERRPRSPLRRVASKTRKHTVNPDAEFTIELKDEQTVTSSTYKLEVDRAEKRRLRLLNRAYTYYVHARRQRAPRDSVCYQLTVAPDAKRVKDLIKIALKVSGVTRRSIFFLFLDASRLDLQYPERLYSDPICTGLNGKPAFLLPPPKPSLTFPSTTVLR